MRHLFILFYCSNKRFGTSYPVQGALEHLEDRITLCEYQHQTLMNQYSINLRENF